LISVTGFLHVATIVDEVNFDPRAKAAIRTCMDDMQGRDLTIITTNEVEQIDRGIRSRAEIVTVPIVTPDVFVPYAQKILIAEGVVIDDALVEMPSRWRSRINVRSYSANAPSMDNINLSIASVLSPLKIFPSFINCTVNPREVRSSTKRSKSLRLRASLSMECTTTTLPLGQFPANNACS
jgi:hypothetical protein